MSDIADLQMLAATLLLTHTDEEQAFWVLSAMIDRLLPTDFYAPSLLASRTDQAVLAELVQVHLPRVAGTLEELGVDLASITFGWFLSLFTDCLPVEVSLVGLILVLVLERTLSRGFGPWKSAERVAKWGKWGKSSKLKSQRSSVADTLDAIPSMGCLLCRGTRHPFPRRAGYPQVERGGNMRGGKCGRAVCVRGGDDGQAVGSGQVDLSKLA